MKWFVTEIVSVYAKTVINFYAGYFGKFEAHTRNCFISLKVFRLGSNYFNEIDIFPLLLISGRSCRTIDNWDFFVLCLLF